MALPVAAPLTLWAAPTSAPALTWDWARERIERCESYWLTTVGASGAPVSRPVWGNWLDDRLLVTCGSPHHRRNAQERPLATATLGDAIEVVVLQGVFRAQLDREIQRRFAEAHDVKYHWHTDVESQRYVEDVYELVPDTVLAWIAAPPEESSPDMDFPLGAGKWVFDRSDITDA